MMLIALTGTPGTGKTSVAKVLEGEYRVIYLKEYREAWMYWDGERDSYVIDLEVLRERVMKEDKDEKIIVEGHYSHEMPVDMVIVLRCHPCELERRLKKRDYREEKIKENVEAEAMSLITSEAIIYHGKDNVFEVDTTWRKERDVAKDVRKIIETRDRSFAPRINYSEEILKWY